ncbi:MAG: phage head closure protein [Hyphomicrobiaceae bacterium]|nr:phage head closure protein [Hyphomicrobiaceae bacterium]
MGDLRHRVVLEAASRADDGSGGAVETWTEVDTVWASIKPTSGGERDIANQIAGRVTHEIAIRFRDGVRPEMRFRLDARIFEILAVVDDGERRRFLKCLSEERDL